MSEMYAAERAAYLDARDADAWRYPEPGQWVGGSWHEPEYEDVHGGGR